MPFKAKPKSAEKAIASSGRFASRASEGVEKAVVLKGRDFSHAGEAISIWL
jgi:hypothetical protein